MTYYLVGSGNMAAFLAARMQAAGHTCLGIYSRNQSTALELAQQYQVPLLQAITEVHDGADACLLAVSDSALKDPAAKPQLRTTVLLHHSGSVGIQALSIAARHTGVVWPVYSILKQDLPTHRQFPCVWEAGTDEARRIALEVCTAISGIQYEADSARRQWLHLTAVIGNNFTNYLLGICTDICRQQELPFSLLQPILQQTIDRTNTYPPKAVQTGPAKRGDQATLDAQVTLLETNPHWQEVYLALSRAIAQTYADKQPPATGR